MLALFLQAFGMSLVGYSFVPGGFLVRQMYVLTLFCVGYCCVPTGQFVALCVVFLARQAFRAPEGTGGPLLLERSVWLLPSHFAGAWRDCSAVVPRSMWASVTSFGGSS